MENQKNRSLIKTIILYFLFLGIITMSYAENFEIKHRYIQVEKTFNQTFNILMPPSYYGVTISNDDYVITKNLSGIFSVKSDDFGIFKAPLTEEMKRKMKEVNRILRIPKIEKILATTNEEKAFTYVLDNNTQREKNETIVGFKIYDRWDNDEFLKYGKQSQVKHSKLISDFISDLEDIGYSKNNEKFADFYGTTNIIPKKEGLEVILTLKNVGPFDVTLSNPKSWEAIPKVGEEVNTDKTWYEIVFGGLYKDVSWTTRFGLENKYLIKDELQSDQALYGSFIVKSNAERALRFLVPYKDIEFRSNTGLIDGNRTKERYVLLDYHAGVLDSSWSMYIDFGGIFSQRVWKAEKTSTVKGWINLE